MSRLYIHPVNDYTGSTIVLEQIIKNSKNEEHLLLTRGNSGPLNRCEGILIKNIPDCTIPGTSKRVHLLNYLGTILNLFLEFVFTLRYGYKYDEFYINTTVPFCAALAGKIMRKNITYHVHEKYVKRCPIRYKIAEFVFRNINSHRIYVSKYLASQFESSSNGKSEVKLNKLTPEFLSKVKIKTFDEHKRDTIMMACSLNYSKGISQFITLAKELPTLKFILIIASDENSILQYIKEDIPNNLKLLARQESMHKWYYMSDIILNLSLPDLWIETFGMTILEGFSYGLPAIGPNVGGPVEIISDGVDGFLVNPYDIEKIKQKIQFILSSENYIKISKKAYLKSLEINGR